MTRFCLCSHPFPLATRSGDPHPCLEGLVFVPQCPLLGGQVTSSHGLTPWVRRTAFGSCYGEPDRRGSLYRARFCSCSQPFPLLGGQVTPHLHILNDLFLFMFSGSCTLGCGGLPLGSCYWELNRRGSLYRTIFCWRSQLFPLLGGGHPHCLG